MYYNTTYAMENAIMGLLPFDIFDHNPNITDKDAHTVEYYLQ